MRRVLPLALLALAGCDLSMTRQEKREPQSSATLWPGGPAAGLSPEGTVDREQPVADASLANPPHVTPALLVRGQDLYTGLCAPCHGGAGNGDGIVVQRGFPRPASFHDPRLLGLPASHTVDAITRGYGVMYDFSERVEPADRWAIAAYVKALQKAGADKGGGS